MHGSGAAAARRREGDRKRQEGTHQGSYSPLHGRDFRCIAARDQGFDQRVSGRHEVSLVHRREKHSSMGPRPRSSSEPNEKTASALSGGKTPIFFGTGHQKKQTKT